MSEKTFPRTMNVWDYSEEESQRRTVIHIEKTIQISHPVIVTSGEDYSGGYAGIDVFMNAKEIE